MLRLLFSVLLNQFGDQRGPTGLMAGADAGAVIAMEIFVKGHEIAPVRVVLKFLGAAENRPASVSSRRKIFVSRCEISPAVSQRFDHSAGAGGTLDFVLIAVEKMKFLQRFDQ